MARQPPPFARKSSTPWERLRPVKQDPLEAMGYVSKGDNRLLDLNAQEAFYRKIVSRYMQFCTKHEKDLDNAFAALSLYDENLVTSASTRNAPNRDVDKAQSSNSTVSSVSRGLSASKWASEPARTSTSPAPAPAPAIEAGDDLSIILGALRKLREGLLATSSTAPSPVFSQRVHVFNIRVAILALHPPSYHPSLSYLLAVLHTKHTPLPDSELKEMTTYMILDLALRQNDLIAAYALRANSRRQFGYQNRQLDTILKAVVTGNWVSFWRTRRQVDGYIRAMMHWHVEYLRKATLKSFGRAYMKVDLKWLLRSASGDELDWDEMVAREEVGWSLDGEYVVIRKPKIRS